MKKSERIQYKTLFLSDIHLGTPDSKVDELIDFLKLTHCKRLVLNGDIVDGWQLKRGSSWTDKHTKLVRTVLKKMEKEDVEVIYLRGNHDDILERFLPINFGKLIIEQEYVHQTAHGDYLVVHGDGFDAVTTSCKFIAELGSVGYELLLRLNRLYNKWRNWQGKEYFSLSKAVKAKVKSAVSFVGRYEEQLQNLARARGCVGIICGHIHSPADKKIGNIHYLNSGDWVESLTAIAEHHDGRFEVIEYTEFKKQFPSETPKSDKDASGDGGSAVEDTEESMVAAMA